MTPADKPVGEVMAGWADGRLARNEIAKATHESYASHIALFVAHVGADRTLGSITPEDIESWLAHMCDVHGLPVASSTKNTRSATVRVFFGWATERGLIERNPARLVGRARVGRRPPKRLPPEQVAAVLERAPFRSRVLLTLALQLGLRRGELAGLMVEDWDRSAGTLTVRGKGDHHRVLPVTVEAAEALTAWLADGRRSGPLFPSSHRPGQPVGPSTIAKVVQQAGEAAGVHLWPHLLRHTMASDVAATGAPVGALQKALGHADISTTGIYIHASAAEVREAIDGRRYRPAPVLVPSRSEVPDFT